MRPQVDTTVPSTAQFDHVRNNLKGEQLLEERYREIDRENRILLQKMSDVMKQQSYSTPRARSGPPSLNRDARKTELTRITQENFAILKRIQQAQPVYNHIAWEDEYRKSFGYLKNTAEYPVVLKRKASNASNTGYPMSVQSRQDPSKSEAGGLVRDASDPGAGEELRYVFKEGKRIGEGYYLVEMATDGWTLAISAYEGESQQNLELVVNERNHRKLYRECKGDYGLLADRLVVEDGQLFVDAGVSPLSADNGATKS